MPNKVNAGASKINYQRDLFTFAPFRAVYMISKESKVKDFHRMLDFIDPYRTSFSLIEFVLKTYGQSPPSRALRR